MKKVRAAIFLVVAGIALAPEVGRYRAQMALGKARAALLDLASRPPGPQRNGYLLSLRDLIEGARAGLPYDSRPTFYLGSSALLRAEPAEAMLRLRESLAIEERPETDINLSRAHFEAGEPGAARIDAVRAVWLDPNLIEKLPDSKKPEVAAEIESRQERLTGMELGAVPPLDSSDPPARQNDR